MAEFVHAARERRDRLGHRAAFLLIAGASLFLWLGLVEIAERVVAWAG